MKSKRITILAVSALAFGLVAIPTAFVSSASALIVQETYTGIVGCPVGFTCTTVDTNGFFGVAGTDLSGKAYTATYLFDTSVGAFSDPNTVGVQGGSLLATPSPSLGASITINGVTISIAGSLFAELLGENDGPPPALTRAGANVVLDAITGLFNEVDNFNGAFPRSITAPFSYTVSSGDLPAGQVALSAEVLTLVPDSVTLTVNETPIPAALPLFASGGALLGFLGWRKKRKQAA